MEIKPSDQTCDKLNLTSGGAFTYGGTLALQVVAGETLAGGEMFDLFDFTGASDGSFAITTDPALAANLNWWEGLLASEGKLVLNRAPTGVVDHGFTRAKGVSMKIKKADLMAGVSDPDSASGDSASFDQFVYSGGATLSADATYVYYVPAAPDDGNDDTVPFRVKDTRGGTVTRHINITVGPAYGLVEIRHDGGGEVMLSFYGIPNCKYYIQRKCGDAGTFSDLTGPITTPADGLIRYTNTPGSGCNPAFYRTRSEDGRHASQSGAK